MELEDIVEFGTKIPCFLGVFFPEDLFKLNITKTKIGFICVSDEHAIAVFISDETIEVFDPLGPANALFSPLCQFLYNNLPCKTLKISGQIQSDTSSQCAQFCLIFLMLRCLGYDYETIASYYSCDLMANDDKASALFDNLFL